METTTFVSRRKFVGLALAALGATALAGCGASGASSGASSSASSAAGAASSASAGASAASGASSAAASTASSSGGAGKALVVFFSQTSNTAGVAAHIAEHAHADVFELKAAEPYTAADLDYNDSSTRATVEQNTPEMRPAIAELPGNLDGYDVVYVGYPIWWGKAPRLMCMFAESVDLAGKKVVPFCTSGSSDIASSADELAALASPDATWLAGRRFAAGADAASVAAWMDGLGL